MSGTFNTIKGRIHEAFGALTGNKRTQTKGRAEQVVGKVEHEAGQEVDEVRHAAKASVDAAKDRADKTVDKAKQV